MSAEERADEHIHAHTHTLRPTHSHTTPRAQIGYFLENNQPQLKNDKHVQFAVESLRWCTYIFCTTQGASSLSLSLSHTFCLQALPV
jgi:hypothetical protein